MTNDPTRFDILASLQKEIERVNKINTELLTAANGAVDAWSGGSQAEIDSSMSHLQAAIAKAEEPAP